MVQVIAKLENHKGKLAETLGMSLGQGIGNGLNTFFANRSLDSVLHDKALKDAPQSQKLEAMRSALSPYGEKGQEIFNQRMQIEQQEMQENQERKNQAQQKIKGKAIGKLSRGEQLSDEEWERASFTPQEVAALHKAYNPKPAGGLGAQAVPPEVSKAIGEVLNSSRGKTADELKQDFDAAGIPPAYTNSYVENRRQESKPIFEPESEKLEAKRVADLATSIETDHASAKNENIRLDRMEELSGKEGLSTPLMVKALDTIGLPIGILSNPDTEEYRKLETDFIRDARDVFPGGRITNYEIQSYLKTIPTLLNSKEGREAIIRNRKLFNEAKEIKYDEYKKILKENGGKKPQNLGILLEERVADKISEVEDKFKEGIQKEAEKSQQSIPMLDPQGRLVNIPPNQIEKALKAGAKFR